MSLLLTGSSGFLGKCLLLSIIEKDYEFKLLNRTPLTSVPIDKQVLVDDFRSINNCEKVFAGVDVVIHCAARVHVMNDSIDSIDSPLQAFRDVNTYGTLHLAQQAASAGVQRFIFMSSIKVNGEFTKPNQPFKASDSSIPSDPYGLSKYEAEIGLYEIAKQTGMEVVIIRPPLVYGPGVKANFASMMKWVNKGVPLPLGSIKDNKRSLVSVDNLVDFITICIDHPNAANQTFLVSDDDDLSTSQLLSNMASALDVSNRLLPIPSSWFTLAAKLIGKPAISQRLCGSLQVDISKTKELLNWKPPYSTAEGMKKTADAFIKNNRK